MESKNIYLAVVDTGKFDTVQTTVSFPVQPPYFQTDVKSIIVIWPTGTGTTIKMDTFIAEEVIIKKSLSVTEQSNSLIYVRFYPNPTNGILRIQKLNPSIKIKSIRIYDLQGRATDIDFSNFDESSIDIEKYVPGIYFLELEFTNKEIARFRIVKTN